jgi:hypothetical protein
LNEYFFGETIFLGMFDALNTNLLTKIENKMKIFTFALILIRKPGNFAYFSTRTTYKYVGISQSLKSFKVKKISWKKKRLK